MAGTGAVDELALKVANSLAAVEDTHTATVGHISHIRHLHIVALAIAFKFGTVLCSDHHRHSLLRLADGQLGDIQSRVLGGNPVDIDIQTRSEFPDGDTNASRSEVIGFFYQFGHLRMSKQSLQFALFGRITFLHLTAAHLEGGLGMAFGRTRGTAHSVAPRATSEEEDHIAGGRTLAAHILGLHGTHHRTNLHSLGSVASVIDLAHHGGSQTYLVAVAGVAGSSLAADDTLRQLAGHRLRHRLADVASTSHAHGLIDVRPAGERVADGTAQAGGRTTERLDLCGMVVGLVLELEQPFLHTPVHIHIHEDAASVVLLAALHIIQKPLRAQETRANSG